MTILHAIVLAIGLVALCGLWILAMCGLWILAMALLASTLYARSHRK